MWAQSVVCKIRCSVSCLVPRPTRSAAMTVRAIVHAIQRVTSIALVLSVTKIWPAHDEMVGEVLE
jgi:hypothetical protein